MAPRTIDSAMQINPGDQDKGNDIDYQKALKQLRNVKLEERLKAVESLSRRFEAHFRRMGINYYYLAKYISERLAGIKFEYELNDFTSEALIAGHNALLGYHNTLDRGLGTGYLNGFVNQDLGEFLKQIWPFFEYKQINSLIVEMRDILATPKNLSMDEVALSDEYVISEIELHRPEMNELINEIKENVITKERIKSFYKIVQGSRRVEGNDLKKAVRSVLRTLLPREEETIKLLYGLEDGEEWSLERIAKKYDLSSTRIQQIRDSALTKLKKYLRSKYLRPFLGGSFTGQDISTHVGPEKPIGLRSIKTEAMERKEPLTMAEKKELLNLVSTNEVGQVPFGGQFSNYQLSILSYVLKKYSTEQIAQKIQRNVLFVNDQMIRILKKLRFLFTLGMLNKFGSNEQVIQALIQLTSEMPHGDKAQLDLGKDQAMPAKLSEDEQFVPGLDNRIILDKRTGRIRFNGDVPVLTPTFIFLAERHGQTYGNQNRVYTGSIEGPMSQLAPEGKEQAKKGAALLLEYPEIKEAIDRGEKVVIATSELQRTPDTAAPFIEILKKAGGKIDYIFDDNLRKLANEMDGGEGSHKQNSQMSAEELTILEGLKAGLNATLKFEDGENFLDLLIRAKKWLDQLNMLYPGRTVVLFGHGTFLSAVRILLGDNQMTDDTGHLTWNWDTRLLPNATPVLLFSNRKIKDNAQLAKKNIDIVKDQAMYIQVSDKDRDRIEKENEELRYAAGRLMDRLAPGSKWRDHWMSAAEIPVSESVRFPGDDETGGIIRSPYQVNYYLNLHSSREIILDFISKAITDTGKLSIDAYKNFLNEAHRRSMIGRDAQTVYRGNGYGKGLDDEKLSNKMEEIIISKVLKGGYDLKKGYIYRTLPKSFKKFLAYVNLSPNASRERIIRTISDYYRATIYDERDYPFGGARVNNSLIMNIVNTMLRLKGFKGISHVRIDAEMIDLDRFYKSFLEAVNAANPVGDRAMRAYTQEEIRDFMHDFMNAMERHDIFMENFDNLWGKITSDSEVKNASFVKNTKNILLWRIKSDFKDVFVLFKECKNLSRTEEVWPEDLKERIIESFGPILEKLKQAEKLSDELRTIKPKASDAHFCLTRAVQMVTRFLDQKGINFNPSPVSLKSYISAEVRYMEEFTEIRPKILISDNAGEVMIDIDQFDRVLENLAKNSREAKGGPVQITISAERKAKNVYIIYSDNGPGFPQDLLDKGWFFQSGHTTKETQGGTGIGLVSSKRIVEEHGGDIRVENIIGTDGKIEGAQFIIRLPVAAKEDRAMNTDVLTNKIKKLEDWIRLNASNTKEVDPIEEFDVSSGSNLFQKNSNSLNEFGKQRLKDLLRDERIIKINFTEKMSITDLLTAKDFKRLSNRFEIVSSFIVNQVSSYDYEEKFSIRELLKNSFVHGNKFIKGLPVYLKIDSKRNFIECYDFGASFLNNKFWGLDRLRAHK